jgi:CelD/BcsL family acetyltransferase involved in cellulose biosynthesis
MAITLETISSNCEFNKIKAEWQYLIEKSDSTTFFLSFHWLYIWWQHYSSAKDTLNVIILRDNNELAAIFPLYISQNVLRFIGTNNNDTDEVCTEYCDIICLKGFEDIAVPLLAKEMNNYLRHSFELQFSDYLENSILNKLVIKLQLQYWVIKQNVGVRYCASLPASFDSYLTSLSPSFTKKMRRLSKKCNNQLDSHIDKTVSKENIITNLKILKKLHTSHWNLKEKTGAFSSVRFFNFHYDLCISLHHEQKLQLWILSIAEEPISAIYCIDDKNTRYFYQTGINTKFKPNISPGNLLHLHVIEDAINNGFQRYDFMKGDATNSYKQTFTNHTYNMYNAHIFKKSPRNTYKMVLWWLKHFRNTIR